MAWGERRECRLRFSLGVDNTGEELDYLLEHLPPIITELRSTSPLNPSHPDNPAGAHTGTR